MTRDIPRCYDQIKGLEGHMIITVCIFLQLSVKNCFIRGSVVRYVQLPVDEVDTQLLQDAARREAQQQRQ